MENKNIIAIEEQEKEDARALTQSYARSDVKSRAYVNALGARMMMKYFGQANISLDGACNLHNIRKILEEFDISDIRLPNINIDVRVVSNDNQIFIPKTHFEYNLLPDIYIVLKFSKDHTKTKFLGFFEPKLINKNNANDDYYFIEKEKLSSPVDLKNFIENYKGNNSKDYSEEDISNAEFLMVSMADNNITEEDKRKLLEYLVNSAQLRDEFIEFENFEMLSYQAASIVGLELPVKESEIDIAEISEDELSSEITDELAASPEIIEEQHDISDNESSKGAAVLGAEIEGAATASAALAGTEGEIDTTANIVNAAANVANITSEAIDMASSIQNMAEQVFADEELVGEQPLENIIENQAMEELELPEQIDTLDNLQQQEEPAPVAPTDNITKEAETQNISEQNEEITDNNISQEAEMSELLDTSTSDENLDLLFSDFNDPDENTVDYNDSNDIVFSNDYSGSDDIVFENSDEDITYTSSGSGSGYGDDLVFESNGDYDDASYSKPKNPLAHGMHTPISEATELTSFENIQTGNIPKMQTPQPAVNDLMETMEMDEFHNLVKNYVPPVIKNESETVGFESINSNNLSTSEPKKEVEKSEPIQNTVQSAIESDNFVEDMPQEIDLAGALNHSDEVSSDNFVEDMPQEIDLAGALNHSDEVSSDNFVEDMPQEIDLAGALNHSDEVSSDNFVEDMPQEVTAAVPQKIQSASANSQEESSIIDELNQLDSIGLGEIEPPVTVQAQASENDESFTINEEDFQIDQPEEQKLEVLYDNSNPKLDTTSLETPEEENFDFRPQQNKFIKFAPVFAILAAIIIAGSIVGFLIKNKNNIDAETLIQTTPENELLATPEADNANILANSEEETSLPQLPKDAADVSPSAPAIPQESKTPDKAESAKPTSVDTSASNKPLNGSKTVTLKKISWEVPDYLSYSENIKKYLQTAGKSIKLTLSSDLLLTNEYIYSNQVKVSLKLNNNGDIQTAAITKSSGSVQVDKIVLQTVKETLNVVKPAQGEVPTPNYNLALIIYL